MISRYSFLSSLARIEYDLNATSVSRVAEEVIRQAKMPLEKIQTLDQTVLGRKLRPNQSSQRVAIYFPERDTGLWTRALKLVQDRLPEPKWQVIVVSKENSRGLSRFEHLVWATCRSKFLFIDTTNPEGPDLDGSFALGFALGASPSEGKKVIVRLEQSGKERGEELSMWDKGHYEIWTDADALANIILARLPFVKK